MNRTNPRTVSDKPLVRAAGGLGLATAVVLGLAGLYFLFGGGGSGAVSFKVALVVAGVVEGMACLGVLRRSRAGWSVALALNGTLAVAFFFGSPRLRDTLEASLAVGLLPCVLFATLTTLLVLSADEYR